MVVCHRCILTGYIAPLHVETWVVRRWGRDHITRYWSCPICKLEGSRTLR